MQTVTLKISDDYAQKLFSLLELFPKNKVKILSQEPQAKFLESFPTPESYAKELKNRLDRDKKAPHTSLTTQELQSRIDARIAATKNAR
ncbi:MAG: hypothetical protein KU37_11765 [Sulfuricurvum sp. PC08-66]|nr:MAG: hypothetical protein KU37_11765 [Sulfuricurvum sp. PC08-66]